MTRWWFFGMLDTYAMTFLIVAAMSAPACQGCRQPLVHPVHVEGYGHPFYHHYRR